MIRKKTVNQSVTEQNKEKNAIDEVERLTREAVYKNSKEGKKARRDATKRERRSNLSYNGFGAKNIEFDMFLTTMQYIVSLNSMLRTDNRQSHTNKKTPRNVCILNNKAYLYGDLDNRIAIRRELIRYTNKLEKDRNLEKDKIIVQIGSIDYRYDRYITETINERVVNDAMRRIKGINDYMKGRYHCFVGFLLNDFRSRIIMLYIFAVQETKESSQILDKNKDFEFNLDNNDNLNDLTNSTNLAKLEKTGNSKTSKTFKTSKKEKKHKREDYIKNKENKRNKEKIRSSPSNKKNQITEEMLKNFDDKIEEITEEDDILNYY